jgi:hypothetical protein
MLHERRPHDHERKSVGRAAYRALTEPLQEAYRLCGAVPRALTTGRRFGAVARNRRRDTVA